MTTLPQPWRLALSTRMALMRLRLAIVLPKAAQATRRMTEAMEEFKRIEWSEEDAHD